MQKTALYDLHKAMNGKMLDFSGWLMPINYGSQIKEHKAVRKHHGMFDVSHMTIIDLHGRQCEDFLRYLLANDVAKLVANQALYSCMLNENAGVIDDLIAYFFSPDFYRLVLNAGTREKDFAWIQQQAINYKVEVIERQDLSMIAVQGPQASAAVMPFLPQSLRTVAKELKTFHSVMGEDCLVARTGYTGEDGFEIILPHKQALRLWQQLADAGVSPCGLGARDTLRLEAGMNLYGLDMDETVTPLESGLTWTVAWQPDDRAFIGRQALMAKKQSRYAKRYGLLFEGKGVLRHGQKVYDNNDNFLGMISSGSFSPSLGQSIAFARLSDYDQGSCQVEMRGKLQPVSIVKLPFITKRD